MPLKTKSENLWRSRSSNTVYTNNKKVLLRERKRLTARRVVGTHSVVLSWLTPPTPLPANPPPRLADPPLLADPPPWLADPPPHPPAG